ncbi:MAG: sulfotransferase family 2 domain-containing protein [Bacteroidia bacterium]
MHIQKTAGTTLHSILQRQVKASEQLETNIYTRQNLPDTIDRDVFSKMKIIRGHFGFEIKQYTDHKRPEFITILREPLDRCISNYYYIRKRRALYQQDLNKKHIGSLEDILDAKKYIFMDNLQVRLISGNLKAPYGSVDQLMLEQAKHNMEHYFSLTGIQEEFDAFIVLLTKMYDLRLPYYRQHRKTEGRATVQEIAPAIQQRILELNKYDTALYAFAKERFEKSKLTYGSDFPKDLAAFRRQNNLISTLINWIPFYHKTVKDMD